MNCIYGWRKGKALLPNSRFIKFGDDIIHHRSGIAYSEYMLSKANPTFKKHIPLYIEIYLGDHRLKNGFPDLCLLQINTSFKEINSN